LGICTAHIVSSIHQTVRINVIIFEQDPAKYYPSAAPQDDLSKSIKSATASPWVDSIAHRSFTQDDWSVQIILHIALSIERRGGILARAILEMAAQHRKKETRRRGWLRSAVAPEGMRVRQERGYLVGAIGLLLAEPLDLLLEPPDLLLHVHGASDCRSDSIPGLRALSVRASEFLDLVVVAAAGVAGYFRCRGGPALRDCVCRQPSHVDRLIWKWTGEMEADWSIAAS